MTKYQRKVTSKQVAERAGVSQTTVSFVLNDVENSNISEETRQRVLQAAHDLHYVPDTAARALARGRSNNIALVLVQPHQQVFIDEFIPKVLTGLSNAAQEHGFRILVELLKDITNPNAYIDLIRGKEAAGMVVSHYSPTPEAVQKLVPFAQEGFPIVMLDYQHPDLYTVTVDKLSGVRKLMRHLVKLGHRRIACISYVPPGDVQADARLQVYRRVLKQVGVDYDETLVRYGAYDPETGYTAMQSLLQVKPLPTAVFAMNDVMAFGAIRAIHEAGLRVPQDIAIVGFDDIRLAPFSTPPLTTIHEPDVEHGYYAGEMLIDLINGVSLPKKVLQLQTELIVRDSCGARLRENQPAEGGKNHPD